MNQPASKIKIVTAALFTAVMILIGCTSGYSGPSGPIANFTASNISGPGPLTVSFSDQSRGQIDTWEWDFYDEGVVNSTQRSPTFTYSAVGTYTATVTLTVTGPGGTDTMTKSGYIKVQPIPPTSTAAPGPTPTPTRWPTPTPATGPLIIKSISAGRTHTCASSTSGGVKGWGWNFDRQLGDGTKFDRPTPVDVLALTGEAVNVSSGARHTCGLMNGGAIKCWGLDHWGLLGDGTPPDQRVPVDVAGENDEFVSVSSGDSHVCALTKGRRVKCWGSNGEG